MARCLLDLENQTETDFNLARIYIDCCSINSYSIAGSFWGTIKLGSLVKIDLLAYHHRTQEYHHGFEEITNYYSQVTCSYAVIKGIRVGALKSVLYDGVYSIFSTMKTKIDNLPR